MGTDRTFKSRFREGNNARVLGVSRGVVNYDCGRCGLWWARIESNDFTSEIVRVRINNNASVGTHL